MVNGYRGVGRCVFPCTALASKTGHLPLVAKTQAKICPRKQSATRTVGIIKDIHLIWFCMKIGLLKFTIEKEIGEK